VSVMPMPSMPAPMVGSILQDGGPPGSGPVSTSPPSTGDPTSSGGGTRVFGNLQGRDPDLIYADEKIMINGKEVTVQSGDTLSSLAAKHGTTVDKLIAENKMDASLLGKNGPNGAYYTPGGLQPAPGGSKTPPVDALAPQGPNGTYTKEQVPALRAEVERLQKEGKLEPTKATELLGLLQKVENGETLSASDATKLTGLMKDLKAAQGNSTPAEESTGGTPLNESTEPKGSGNVLSAPRDPALEQRINGKLNKPDEIKYRILGGELDSKRVAKLIEQLDVKKNTGGLSEAEQSEVRRILNEAPGKGEGMGLTAAEKYLVNKWLVQGRLLTAYADPPGTGDGQGVETDKPLVA
jgi:murein DD-endopeptidase MepM/ murein hydrolase activator NlpD